MKKNILAIFILALFPVMLMGCSTSVKSDTWRLGDYKGEFMGLRMDGNEDEIVILRFEFTNYSNEAISFQDALNPTAYQDGGELARVTEEVDSAAILVNPGETLSIDMQFYMQDKNSLIQVEISNELTGEKHSTNTHSER